MKSFRSPQTLGTAVLLIAGVPLFVASNVYAQAPGDVTPNNASVHTGVSQTLTFTVSYYDDGSSQPELDLSIGNSGCVFAGYWNNFNSAINSIR
jgi:hypothetical protein